VESWRRSGSTRSLVAARLGYGKTLEVYRHGFFYCREGAALQDHPSREAAAPAPSATVEGPSPQVAGPGGSGGLQNPKKKNLICVVTRRVCHPPRGPCLREGW
jgi:hypothetical protein